MQTPKNFTGLQFGKVASPIVCKCSFNLLWPVNTSVKRIRFYVDLGIASISIVHVWSYSNSVLPSLAERLLVIKTRLFYFFSERYWTDVYTR